MGGASSIAAKGRAALGAAGAGAAPGSASGSSISGPPSGRTPAISGGPDLMEFAVTPLDEAVRSKSATVILEVGMTGFRLLRPETMDGMFQFPWGQVHSWAHGKDRFSFRFFQERAKQIVRYTFQIKPQDVMELMACIQRIIDKILGNRKSQSISEDDFSRLSELIQSSSSGDRLDCIMSAAKMNFFTAQQAHKLISSLEAAFDKVEAAATLHPRLVDQNRFNMVLEALECPEDKENVWHRLSAQKRQNSTKSRRPGSSSRGEQESGGSSGNADTALAPWMEVLHT